MTITILEVLASVISAITVISWATRLVVWDRVAKALPFGVMDRDRPYLRLGFSEGVFHVDYIRIILDPPADQYRDPGHGSVSGGMGYETTRRLIAFDYTLHGQTASVIR